MTSNSNSNWTTSSSFHVPLLVFYSIILLLSPSHIHAFTCTTPSTSPCVSLVGYIPPNSTTLSAIATLFNLPQFSTLLGPNNLTQSTPSTHPVPANKTLNIPFNCSCFGGAGAPTDPPVYTVIPGDGLFNIASHVFSGLIVFQDIQKFNGITDPDKIDVGQKLKIPLPCSCDEVEGQRVVHYAYIVPPKASVEGIAQMFNVSQVALQRRNNLTLPTDLKAAAVIDVPLSACSSIVTTLGTCNGTGSPTPTPRPAAPSPSSAIPTPTPAAPSPSSATAVWTRFDGRRRWWNQILHLLLLHVALLCVSL